MNNKMIEDLGLQYYAPSKKRVRTGIFECQDCPAHIKSRYRLGFKPVAKLCKSCAGRRGGTTHGLYGIPTYKIWKGIIDRCTNPNNRSYDHYGEKGIGVCDEWLQDFHSFRLWAEGKGFEKGLSVERLNVDLGYSPQNCTIIPMSEQPSNRGKFKNNTSGFKGVSYQKSNQKYKAYIGVNKKVIYLGLFDSAEDAAKKYDAYIEIEGLNRKKNFP